MKRIGILIHANDTRVLDPSHLVWYMADVWCERGFDVCTVRGVDSRVDADALIMHVDLTVIPQEYITFAEQYPRVINGRVHDISKRSISKAMVAPGDGYDGPVIVKTDCNCGGQPESQLFPPLQFPHASKLRRLRDRLTWRWRSLLEPNDYCVFNSPRDVPKGVWKNRHLVVERFMPERQGDDYCIRTWVFFGDREFSMFRTSPEPIAKSRSARPNAVFGIDIPDELRQMRVDLGFDYGKFDFVMVDDRPILFDANRTPLLRIFPGDDREATARMLAEGIHSLV